MVLLRLKWELKFEWMNFLHVDIVVGWFCWGIGLSLIFSLDIQNQFIEKSIIVCLIRRFINIFLFINCSTQYYMNIKQNINKYQKKLSKTSPNQSKQIHESPQLSFLFPPFHPSTRLRRRCLRTSILWFLFYWCLEVAE